MLKKLNNMSKENKNPANSGGIISTPGNTTDYKTGNWINKTLKFIPENCINCTLCWGVCPDDAIILDDAGNMIGVDTDFCKDCGLCTQICPANKNPDPAKHALVMMDNEEVEL